jgi:hypothetical protein
MWNKKYDWVGPIGTIWFCYQTYVFCLGVWIIFGCVTQCIHVSLLHNVSICQSTELISFIDFFQVSKRCQELNQ